MSRKFIFLRQLNALQRDSWRLGQEQVANRLASEFHVLEAAHLIAINYGLRTRVLANQLPAEAMMKITGY
ncbi:hypothetical protein Nhal_1077 [Nitrosococcus halophilus Nc 4]|uniref:Uncharacterized protein n=1 Tax=Nitrosococcus halophilus (strain Nc4) TaxID=472759 RepID=D5BZ36_NITHN|nr:hypothetical protein Nhal_1077 [Nitrosococcus halophilus Nc 4]